ncbi:MAG: enoyl-CoA hydratase/isomerase family protein [Paracoccaceae bacterium]
MAHPVRLEKQFGVAAIIISDPPDNRLTEAVRGGIIAALDAAQADPSIKALVIAARGQHFPSVAYPAEYEHPTERPTLRDVCMRIEDCPKPVIAAMHGTVRGAGLELAMAAHYRIGAAHARFAMSDISVGLPPAAGGSQRLPRLVGAEEALTLLIGGRAIGVRSAQKIGLIDAVAKDDLRKEALALARTAPEPRPTRDLRKHLGDGAAFEQSVALFRAELAKAPAPFETSNLAASKIIDCVEASLLLPFEIGLDFEADAFGECLVSPVSNGLRHMAGAEREAVKFLDLEEAKARTLRKIAVVGQGRRAIWLTRRALDAGYEVVLLAKSQNGVEAALERIGAAYAKAVKAGRITDDAGAAVLSRLTLTTELPKAEDADMFIEALDPNDKKAAIMSRIDSLATGDAVFVSTSSKAAELASMAAASGRLEDLVGLHVVDQFANPGVIEIVVGHDVVADAVATVHEFALRLKLIPVRSGPAEGFIAGALLRAYRAVADRLILQGARPDQVDKAMRKFGFREGPFETRDRLGLDREPFGAVGQVALRKTLCDAGATGRKARVGYYLYGADGAITGVNPVLDEALEAERQQKGITAQKITPAEIQQQMLAGLINAAADLLEEGAAERACDIDVVAVNGLGYPRARGGPTFAADQMTTFAAARRVEAMARQYPGLWEISPLLKRIGYERQRFSSLNAE